MNKINESMEIENSKKWGYITVGLAFLIFLAVYGTFYAFGVFFTPMSTEFGWTRAVTSGAFSVSWILSGLLAIVMGWLCDKLGPRIVLSLSGLLIGAGFLLTCQIKYVWEFYLYYGIILGAGLSGVVVPLFSTIARWFIRKRSAMTGLAAIGVAAGLLLGPKISNSLILRYEWRLSYLILGAIVLFIVVVSAQFLKRPSPSSAVEGEQEVAGSPPGLSLREAVFTRQFWQLFTIFFCLSFGNYVVMVHITPHAIDMGLSPTSAASVLSVMGGLNIVGCIYAMAADRIGTRRIYAISLFLMSACFFWLLGINDLRTMYIFAVIFGFAVSSCCATQTLMVANLFGVKAHGVIFGIANNGYTIGATVAPTIAGYIFDRTGGYSLAFIVSGALTLIGMVLTMVLKIPARVPSTAVAEKVTAPIPE